MLHNLIYYCNATSRRKRLDRAQEEHRSLFRGVVLDIGGRDRGSFRKPKFSVDKWIFADIEEEHNPDIVLDVADMQAIESESIDVVNAIELFEHVERIEDGIQECFRVLKPSGTFIVSMPFLYAVHGDPYDFQRWTMDKWHAVAKEHGFTVKESIVLGRFFTLWVDLAKTLMRVLPKPLRVLTYIGIPLLELIARLDDTRFVQRNARLSQFHGGYYFIFTK